MFLLRHTYSQQFYAYLTHYCQQFDQFCHGGAQLRNMHNKTIIGFGFRMIVLITKVSVCVNPRLQPLASADHTNFGLDNYGCHAQLYINSRD